MEYWLIILIAGIIWGLVWGFATKAVINNKGYKENWFFWGFIFGFIALIVACAKPAASSVNSTKGNEISEKAKVDAILKYKDLLDVGAITQEEYDKKKKELLDSNVSSINEIENFKEQEEKQVEKSKKEDSLKDWLLGCGISTLIISPILVAAGVPSYITRGEIGYLLVAFTGGCILVLGVILFGIAFTRRN